MTLAYRTQRVYDPLHKLLGPSPIGLMYLVAHVTVYVPDRGLYMEARRRLGSGGVRGQIVVGERAHSLFEEASSRAQQVTITIDGAACDALETAHKHGRMDRFPDGIRALLQ